MKWYIFIIIVTLFAFLTTTCNEPLTGGNDESDFNLPSTPVECLENLEQSLNSRNPVLYELCLADDFTFYFDPHDVGVEYENEYIIPMSWDYEADVRAVSKMLREAKNINFSIDTSTVGNPDGDDTEFETADVPVRLQVTIYNDDIIIAEGPTDFTFIREQGPNDEEYWAISEWWDKTSPSDKDDDPPPHPPSVGYIKAYYY
ncbi:MAG: hypothetical protein GY771_01025 [bacterium]|nr:hypothetical protein [bacterium]